MTKEDKRIWIKVIIALGALLPGFPVLMIVIGWPLSKVGFSGPVFIAALALGNLYYFLPAVVFGSAFFPVEEFGYLPTSEGTALAAILYAVIAVALSVPLVGQIRKRKARD